MRAGVEAWARSIGDAWRRFWFDPVQTSTLAVIRIAVGFTTLAWGVSLIPDLFDFFSAEGVLPTQPSYTDEGSRGSWGLLGITDDKWAAVALVAALIVGSAFLMVGFLTRLAAVVVFVCVMSFERRNPFVFNSGDTLLRVLTFYLMLAPAGASLSVDRWLRAKERFWEFPLRAPWALRLIQVQLSILYITAV